MAVGPPCRVAGDCRCEDYRSELRPDADQPDAPAGHGRRRGLELRAPHAPNEPTQPRTFLCFPRCVVGGLPRCRGCSPCARRRRCGLVVCRRVPVRFPAEPQRTLRMAGHGRLFRRWFLGFTCRRFGRACCSPHHLFHAQRARCFDAEPPAPGRRLHLLCVVDRHHRGRCAGRCHGPWGAQPRQRCRLVLLPRSRRRFQPQCATADGSPRRVDLHLWWLALALPQRGRDGPTWHHDHRRVPWLRWLLERFLDRCGRPDHRRHGRRALVHPCHAHRFDVDALPGFVLV